MTEKKKKQQTMLISHQALSMASQHTQDKTSIPYHVTLQDWAMLTPPFPLPIISLPPQCSRDVLEMFQSLPRLLLVRAPEFVSFFFFSQPGMFCKQSLYILLLLVPQALPQRFLTTLSRVPHPQSLSCYPVLISSITYHYLQLSCSCIVFLVYSLVSWS